MRPEKAIAELRELRLLRQAALLLPQYDVGKLRVIFPRQFKSADEAQRVINDTSAAVLRQVLPAEEMRTRMANKINAKIAALEAKYPGLVD